MSAPTHAARPVLDRARLMSVLIHRISLESCSLAPGLSRSNVRPGVRIICSKLLNFTPLQIRFCRSFSYTSQGDCPTNLSDTAMLSLSTVLLHSRAVLLHSRAVLLHNRALRLHSRGVLVSVISGTVLSCSASTGSLPTVL